MLIMIINYSNLSFLSNVFFTGISSKRLYFIAKDFTLSHALTKLPNFQLKPFVLIISSSSKDLSFA